MCFVEKKIMKQNLLCVSLSWVATHSFCPNSWRWALVSGPLKEFILRKLYLESKQPGSVSCFFLQFSIWTQWKNVKQSPAEMGQGQEDMVTWARNHLLQVRSHLPVEVSLQEDKCTRPAKAVWLAYHGPHRQTQKAQHWFVCRVRERDGFIILHVDRHSVYQHFLLKMLSFSNVYF